MKYHNSGAFIGSVATGDGKTGFFDESGAVRLVPALVGDFGVYDPSGAVRTTDCTDVTEYVGMYAKDGSWNVTFVTGADPVGAFAKNGSRNFFLAS